MIRWVRWVLLAAVAVVVAVVFDPKWVLAPLAGYVIYRLGVAMLRNMAIDTPHGVEPADPVGGAPDERTLYWCELCGAELLLVAPGSNAVAPRHCGERMHGRVELAPRTFSD